MHEIETQRMYLRQVEELDKHDFFCLLEDKAVIEYCFDPMSHQDIRETFSSRVQYWDVNSSHWLCLAMFRKSDNVFVGLNGFKVANFPKTSEVGFMVSPNFQGLGYAKESLTAVMDYSYEQGFSSIIANVTKGNIGSVNVLASCGFKLTETEPNGVTVGGVSYDNLVYKNVCSTSNF